MLIRTLVENDSESKEFGAEHGLSLYIEMSDCKILFDLGASNLFYKNAKKMGIRIADVDCLVISHGHYDHGGGLKTFLSENKKAGIYLHRRAFDKYYGLRSNNEIDYIGLDDKNKNHKQIIYTSDRFFINENLQLFSNVKEIEPRPLLNRALLVERKGELIGDEFDHEQHLIIDYGQKSILVTGCAHGGIINVVEHYKMLRNRMPDYIIGGFHLSNKSQTNTESDAIIEKIGNYLLDTGAICYTGHCTGLDAFGKLKAILGDRLGDLKVGSLIEIEKVP